MKKQYSKIWLDDERDPRQPQIQSLFGADGDEFWVKTADQAIHYLRQGGVTFISLDHDLGPDAGSGMEVANWIEQQAFHGTLERIHWSVHSMNSVGAKNMTKALSNADRFWDERENAAQ